SFLFGCSDFLAQEFVQKLVAAYQVIFIVLFKDGYLPTLRVLDQNRGGDNSGSNVLIFHPISPAFELNLSPFFYQGKPLFINGKPQIPSGFNCSGNRKSQRICSRNIRRNSLI
ncbi:hypothetical protein, partial [Methanosarcina mazei]